MKISDIVNKNVDTKAIAKKIVESAPHVSDGINTLRPNVITVGNYDLIDEHILLDSVCTEFRCQLIQDIVSEGIEARKKQRASGKNEA